MDTSICRPSQDAKPLRTRDVKTLQMASFMSNTLITLRTVRTKKGQVNFSLGFCFTLASKQIYSPDIRFVANKLCMQSSCSMLPSVTSYPLLLNL